MIQMNSVTGVVLAGGKSGRMGTDKAVLNIGGRSMLDRVMHELFRLFDQVLLVTGEADQRGYPGVRVIRDIYPGCGPLGGIHAGLKAAGTPYIFVTGCDMPFVRAELMACLLDHAPGYDLVIPRKGEYVEPLFAVYGKGCIGPAENMLREKKYNIRGFFPEVRVKYIDRKEMEQCAGSDRCFINVNTPEELAEARRMSEDGEV
ncbi:molybdopterin-guanine dinucleotide biosynthesis protein MobA [Desulfocucumis palustris]|uniref:Probable molybdenum cofactor guanylyltransferase n=1 Tax=Desulfocucumis palustris TaxID=1898651 RepID=A0A2L2XCY8_9FIRM|nr:molybdenum cofactor guanylyltransferase [Desulfocucumis palustris]GBF34209.1 molybdopterin-guanine dinucleotide biosynthesis protein MobA [Desulfocucumis palustris]